MLKRHTFTVKEFATFLGIHTDTVYCLVKLNEIPHLRVRNRILFTKESIDRWIEDQAKANLHK